jgi:hypothetical protein
MGDGWHEVRIIAQALSPVTPGGFKDFPVIINKKGRSMAITGLADGAPHQVIVNVSSGGKEKPKEICLLWNGRQLDRKPYADAVSLSFDERVVGEGPHQLQAAAFYEDRMEVRSAPQVFAIEFKTHAE